MNEPTGGSAGGSFTVSSLLAVEGITVRFGGIPALRDVSLAFARGATHGLIGPNGAGKTTMFDVLSGIIAPQEGRVMLHGEEVTGRSATWRARNGMRRTFQRQQTFGWLSVEDNLLAALEWRGGGGGILADLISSPSRRRRESERRQRVEEVLARCGLERCRQEIAGDLPVGLARIVEIGRAIVDPPTVLLLDEPTSGLEEGEVERVGQLIQELSNEARMAIVLVEHDIGFVMTQCDRVTVLNLGSVLAEGTPEEISNDADVIAAYLG